METQHPGGRGKREAVVEGAEGSPEDDAEEFRFDNVSIWWRGKE